MGDENAGRRAIAHEGQWGQKEAPPRDLFSSSALRLAAEPSTFASGSPAFPRVGSATQPLGSISYYLSNRVRCQGGGRRLRQREAESYGDWLPYAPSISQKTEFAALEPTTAALVSVRRRREGCDSAGGSPARIPLRTRRGPRSQHNPGVRPPGGVLACPAERTP